MTSPATGAEAARTPFVRRRPAQSREPGQQDRRELIERSKRGSFTTVACGPLRSGLRLPVDRSSIPPGLRRLAERAFALASAGNPATPRRTSWWRGWRNRSAQLLVGRIGLLPPGWWYEAAVRAGAGDLQAPHRRRSHRRGPRSLHFGEMKGGGSWAQARGSIIPDPEDPAPAFLVPPTPGSKRNWRRNFGGHGGSMSDQG